MAAPLVVVSPHFDDAVFSCGALLAAHPGSVVVTVFAGTPPDPALATEWDARCGFRSAGEAIRARRREDEAALALLDARPRWLEFFDGQYGHVGDDAAIELGLRGAILELRCMPVVYPLGLFHADHVRVHRTTMRALSGLDGVASLVYEDAIYRAMPGLPAARLAALAAVGVVAEAVSPPGTAAADARKAAAVRCYASQLAALGDEAIADTARSERYWRLEERLA